MKNYREVVAQLVEDGLVTPEQLFEGLQTWMSSDEWKEFLEAYELLPENKDEADEADEADGGDMDGDFDSG